jgi:hypothetical protein
MRGRAALGAVSVAVAAALLCTVGWLAIARLREPERVDRVIPIFLPASLQISSAEDSEIRHAAPNEPIRMSTMAFAGAGGAELTIQTQRFRGDLSSWQTVTTWRLRPGPARVFGSREVFEADGARPCDTVLVWRETANVIGSLASCHVDEADVERTMLGLARVGGSTWRSYAREAPRVS